MKKESRKTFKLHLRSKKVKFDFLSSQLMYTRATSYKISSLSLSFRTTSAQWIEQQKFICGLTLWRGHQIQGMTNGGSSEGLCRRRRLRLLWSIKGQDTITLPFFRIHFSILLKWGGKFMSIYGSCCHAHEVRRFLFNILFSHEKCSFMNTGKRPSILN